MANPATVDARIRRWVRVPPTPQPNLRPIQTGSMLRPYAPLSPSNVHDVRRALLVPQAPTANLTFSRWEGAAPGARSNPLPRYMFKNSPGELSPSVSSLLRLGPRGGQ